MRVFISWSGAKSKAVAKALREWLPNVIQSLDPWMSEQDISTGGRWNHNIAEALESCQFGIVCVTEDNKLAPWINFEAGAIAKQVKDSRLVPYLVQIAPEALAGTPLSQFQAKRANETETLAVVQGLNKAIEKPLDETRVAASFHAFWPELASKLEAANAMAPIDPPKVTVDERLTEIANNVRSIVSELAELRAPGAVRFVDAATTGVDLIKLLSVVDMPLATFLQSRLARMDNADSAALTLGSRSAGGTSREAVRFPPKPAKDDEGEG